MASGNDDDDDDGDADDDENFAFHFYIHKLPINRPCGRYVSSLWISCIPKGITTSPKLWLTKIPFRFRFRYVLFQNFLNFKFQLPKVRPKPLWRSQADRCYTP